MMKSKYVERSCIIIAIAICLLTGCLSKQEQKINLTSEQTIPSGVQSELEQASLIEKLDATNLDANSIVTEEVKEEEKTGDSELELVMVGDVLLHTPVLDSGKCENGTYSYDHLFKQLKSQIENADIAIANQEVILGGTELGLSGYPCFNAPYEVADALSNSGFDVILHATNHALDKGESGIRNCIANWKSKHPEMKIAGINENQDEQDNSIVVIEKNSIKIAILNYTYGTNGIPLPTESPYLVNLLNKEKVAKDVEIAKEKADFIVVCPHWGTEYQHEVDENQKMWAKYFADLGVNLVIGTHPHVIEPVCWITGDSGNKTLIYYSLGNYVNATSGQGKGVADRMLGAMADVHIVKDETGIAHIDSFEAHPLVTHLESGKQNIMVYPLESYTSKLEEKNEIKKQDVSFSILYLQKVWEEVMDKKVTY